MPKNFVSRLSSLFSVPIFLFCVLASSAEAPVLTKASISFRVSPVLWQDEVRFEELLQLFEKYKGVTDEITFFTQTTHTPIPDDELVRRCEILRERMLRCREFGYRAGINILCTIGQIPEDLPHSIGPEFQRGIGLTTGLPCPATLCPNNDRFRQRIHKIYTALAEADPDYIWIDDDVRVGHSTGDICFCDSCMKLFNAFAKRQMTREELAHRQTEYEIRAQTVDFSNEVINNIFIEIEKTVHAVRPSLPLGFMTGERYSEGYAFARWARTLAGENSVPVYWRPGGGFYRQDPISGGGGMTAKSHEIGRQIAMLPPDIFVIQSEIENFPYERLQKSKHITALEAACHIAAGCTGAAFNVLTMNHEPLDDFEPLLATLYQWRPFYDEMVRTLARNPAQGVCPAWKPTDGKNPKGNPIRWLALDLAEIGIPFSYDPGRSHVFLLSRNFLNTETREDVLNYLSQGVYTDNDTIGLLNSPSHFNVRDLVGMEYGDTIAVDAIERYTDHPLNANNAGRDRDGRQSFWHDPAIALKKTDDKTEILSSIVDYQGDLTAQMSLGIFENSLGGRICVNGYHPWNHFFSKPKSDQIKRIMRWLSRDRLPAWIDSFHRAHLWVRQSEQGSGGLVIVNTTFDPAENLSIILRTERDVVTACFRDSREVKLQAVEADGPYRRFILPTLAPWDIVLVKCGDT
ncbi:MAG: hypothetical protein Q4G68_00075 [Planctomycetia bacterium]|nr:hypothetical protein [Planctomycetia bacterium]